MLAWPGLGFLQEPHDLHFRKSFLHVRSSLKCIKANRRWKTLAMVERYAHVAPDQLAVAASRLDDLFAGDDLATVGKNQVTAKLPEAL